MPTYTNKRTGDVVVSAKKNERLEALENWIVEKPKKAVKAEPKAKPKAKPKAVKAEPKAKPTPDETESTEPDNA